MVCTENVSTDNLGRLICMTKVMFMGKKERPTLKIRDLIIYTQYVASIQ